MPLTRSTVTRAKRLSPGALATQRQWWSVGVAVCVMACVTRAAVACTTHSWIGPATGGAWGDDANWSPAGPIAADDKVKFDFTATPVLPAGALTVGGVELWNTGTAVQIAKFDGVLTVGEVNAASAGAKLTLAAVNLVITSLSGAGDVEVQSVNSVVISTQITSSVDLSGTFSTLCNGGSATELHFSTPATGATWKFGGLVLGTATQDGTCHTIVDSAVNIAVRDTAQLRYFARLYADQSIVTLQNGVDFNPPAEIRAAGVISNGVCNWATNGGALLQGNGPTGVYCNGVTGAANADILILSQGPSVGPLVLNQITGSPSAVTLQSGVDGSATVSIGSGSFFAATRSGTFTVGGAVTTGAVGVGATTSPGAVAFVDANLNFGPVTVVGSVSFAGALTAVSVDGSAATSFTAAADVTVLCGGAFVVPGPALHIGGVLNANTCPALPSPAKMTPRAAPAIPAYATTAAPMAAPAKAPAAAAPAQAVPSPAAAAATAASRLAKLFARPTAGAPAPAASARPALAPAAAPK